MRDDGCSCDSSGGRGVEPDGLCRLCTNDGEGAVFVVVMGHGGESAVFVVVVNGGRDGVRSG